MPASTEPRSGILYGWAYGESGWHTGMDANLLKLGRFGFHPAVKTRTLTAPPASPASGDSYIVAATATGAWAGKENQIAVWDGAAWQFGVPREGWTAWVDDENVLIGHIGTAWTTGIMLAELASANQAAVTQIAGATYGANEQAMLDALKLLVNQLRDDLITFGAIKGAA